MDADGQDTSTGPYFQFDFEDFELQEVENTEKEKGWSCERGRIAYSMSGYYCRGKKTAAANTGEITESGYYRLKSAVWKVLNFIFCKRCGYPVPGKHGRCHTDVVAEQVKDDPLLYHRLMQVKPI